MKKVLLFALCFTMCGLVVACSDSGGSSGGPKSTVTIEADGVPVNSLELVSNQVVNLKAVLKDKSGNIVDDYITNWTCTDGLGSFSVNNSSETVFTAMNGYFSGSKKSITADCNGVKKKIDVSVEQFSVSLSMQGGNSVVNTGSKQIKATVMRGGVEVTDVPIVWSTSDSTYPGIFTPSTTYSGDYVTYQPNAAGATGMLYVRATVYGTTHSTPVNITN